MQKAHSNIEWENYPSIETPINEQNLNKMDKSIDEIDDRVIVLDTSKLSVADAQKLVKSLTFNRANGVFTVTYFNGSTDTIDTILEKLAVNFDFDETTQQMIITLDDGTQKYVDLSAFIVPLEFIDSNTMDFQLLADGKVTAIVKEGSIQEKHLRPDYLADIKVEVAKAEQSATQSAQSAQESDGFSKLSESFAHGGTGVREGEDTDNSKYYSEQSNLYKEQSEEIYDNCKEVESAINKKLELAEFGIDDDGNLIYTENSPFVFTIDNNGNLNWEVAV